jgi:hypothetical protein
MGLAEKRALKEFQDGPCASCVASLARLASKSVPVEVDWETLGAHVSPGKAHEYWNNTFFLPVVTALEQICKDGFGRDAVSQQLERVRIKGNSRHVFGVAWNRGVLTLDLMIRDDSAVGGPGTKSYKDRVAAIVACLEENLG